MDWQLPITLCVIACAGAYFVWSGYRAWRNSKSGACGGGCGCAKVSEPKSPVLIPAEQLTMRMKR
jgi:hypothetical protein